MVSLVWSGLVWVQGCQSVVLMSPWVIIWQEDVCGLTKPSEQPHNLAISEQTIRCSVMTYFLGGLKSVGIGATDK